MVFIFVCNILLIILYSITMAFSFSYYLKEKNKTFLLIGLYFIVSIFDKTIIYMTEFLHSFATSYNQLFLTTPAIKTITFLLSAFLSFSVLVKLRKEKLTLVNYGVLITLAVWLILIPLIQQIEVRIWLYYLGNQLFLFYLGIYCWQGAKQPSSAPNNVYLKELAVINIVFSLLIILEDSFMIFTVDQYHAMTMKMANWNLSENLFSIVLCLLFCRYFIRERKTPERDPLESQDKSSILQTFCEEYRFTQRESEVFELLLSHYTNQEIADHLFLSLGTVKTHVHNIFIKLKIKKRTQVTPFFEEYQAHQKKKTLLF